MAKYQKELQPAVIEGETRLVKELAEVKGSLGHIEPKSIASTVDVMSANYHDAEESRETGRPVRAGLHRLMTAIPAHNDAPSRTAAVVVPAIDLKGVTKTYPGKGGKATHALGPVNLRIDPGSFVSVVGPSGCGSPRCCASLQRLEMPDTGTMQRYGTTLDWPTAK